MKSLYESILDIGSIEKSLDPVSILLDDPKIGAAKISSDWVYWIHTKGPEDICKHCEPWKKRFPSPTGLALAQWIKDNTYIIVIDTKLTLNQLGCIFDCRPDIHDGSNVYLASKQYKISNFADRNPGLPFKGSALFSNLCQNIQFSLKKKYIQHLEEYGGLDNEALDWLQEAQILSWDILAKNKGFIIVYTRDSETSNKDNFELAKRILGRI